MKTDEMRDLLAKASKEPWHHHTATIGSRYAAVGPMHSKDYGKEMETAEADAELIRVMRQTFPLLLDLADAADEATRALDLEGVGDLDVCKDIHGSLAKLSEIRR